MKEKDLNKCLDNLIIDGLIKEAEQDAIEFAEAMRRTSDGEFEDVVMHDAWAEAADEDIDLADDFCIQQSKFSSLDMKCPQFAHGEAIDFMSDEPRSPMVSPASALSAPKRSRLKAFRPWIAAAVAAVAVILIVLVPSINSMNGRLCESALYMSEDYITAPMGGGFDVSSASPEQIKAELPALEARYQAALNTVDKPTLQGEELSEAGWTLAVAYLRLHKKGDAVKVLKELATREGDTPLGQHSARLLEQLD